MADAVTKIKDQLLGADIAIQTLFESQFKNKFEIIMWPAGIQYSAFAMRDILFMKFNMYSITLPNISFEYEKLDNTRYIKGITRPETLTINFIEDEYTRVRSYLYGLRKSIGYYKNESFIAGNNKLKLSTNFIFNEDQEGLKRNAVIILQTSMSIPNYSVNIKGMKYQSHEEITIGHAEGEHLMISTVFSIDDIYWTPLWVQPSTSSEF